MGLRKSAFTKYEAVILLDGYLDALSGRLSRQASVRRVSFESVSNQSGVSNR